MAICYLVELLIDRKLMASSGWGNHRLRIVLVVLSIAGILGMLALPLNVGMRSVLVIEAVITTALLLMTFVHPAVIQLLTRAPRRYIALSLVLLTCFLAGQWMNQSSTLYPFCEWGMYSSAADARERVTCIGVHVVRKDGQTEYLIPEGYVLTPRKFLGVIDKAGKQAANGKPQVQFDQTPDHVRTLLGHLIDLKNQSDPQNPVVRVVGTERIIALNSSADASSIYDKQTWEVCID